MSQTQRLPVILRIPKQFLITTMWCDVINALTVSSAAVFITHHAKRMRVKKVLTCSAPFIVVVEVVVLLVLWLLIPY